MKIQDKATFDQQNVFGLGQENTGFAQYFYRYFLFEPLDQGRRMPGIFSQCHL